MEKLAECVIYTGVLVSLLCAYVQKCNFISVEIIFFLLLLFLLLTIILLYIICIICAGTYYNIVYTYIRYKIIIYTVYNAVY